MHAPAGHQLTERQCAILDFETLRWKYAGAKEARIRDDFDCSPTRYYQELNALLDLPHALAHNPALVRRLRRLRDGRRQLRSASRLGFKLG